MEPESSLPYSQVLATCPYPEPFPSSPHNPFHFRNILLNIILPSLITTKVPYFADNPVLNKTAYTNCTVLL